MRLHSGHHVVIAAGVFVHHQQNVCMHSAMWCVHMYTAAYEAVYVALHSLQFRY
jgi:hypothetical protein